MSMMQQLDRLRQQQAAASAPVLWDFDQIPTALWLDWTDTSNLTLSGSSITLVSDKSGNGRDFDVAAGDPQYDPTGLSNGNPCMVLTSDVLKLASGSLSEFAFLHQDGGCAVYIVYEVPNADDGVLVSLFSTGNGGSAQTGIFIGKEDRTTRVGVNWVGLARGVTNQSPFSSVTANNVFPNQQPHLVEVRHGTSQINNAEVLKTGNLIYNANYSFPPSTSSNASYTPHIGDGGANSGLWRGDIKIAEIVVLDYLPTAIVAEKIQGRLAHKHGLTANLPAGHPYKTNPPTV